MKRVGEDLLLLSQRLDTEKASRCAQGPAGCGVREKTADVNIAAGLRGGGTACSSLARVACGVSPACALHVLRGYTGPVPLPLPMYQRLPPLPVCHSPCSTVHPVVSAPSNPYPHHTPTPRETEVSSLRSEVHDAIGNRNLADDQFKVGRWGVG